MGKTSFIIRQGHSSFLVSVYRKEVEVQPTEETNRQLTGLTIATTLQTICNTKMIVDQPEDPLTYLKEYMRAKGWTVEDV